MSKQEHQDNDSEMFLDFYMENRKQLHEDFIEEHSEEFDKFIRNEFERWIDEKQS